MPVYIDEVLPKELVFGNTSNYYSLGDSHQVESFFVPDGILDGLVLKTSSTGNAPDTTLNHEGDTVFPQIQNITGFGSVTQEYASVINFETNRPTHIIKKDLFFKDKSFLISIIVILLGLTSKYLFVHLNIYIHIINHRNICESFNLINMQRRTRTHPRNSVWF